MPEEASHDLAQEASELLERHHNLEGRLDSASDTMRPALETALENARLRAGALLGRVAADHSLSLLQSRLEEERGVIEELRLDGSLTPEQAEAHTILLESHEIFEPLNIFTRIGRIVAGESAQIFPVTAHTEPSPATITPEAEAAAEQLPQTDETPAEIPAVETAPEEFDAGLHTPESSDKSETAEETAGTDEAEITEETDAAAESEIKETDEADSPAEAPAPEKTSEAAETAAETSGQAAEGEAEPIKTEFFEPTLTETELVELIHFIETGEYTKKEAPARGAGRTGKQSDGLGAMDRFIQGLENARNNLLTLRFDPDVGVFNTRGDLLADSTQSKQIRRFMPQVLMLMDYFCKESQRIDYSAKQRPYPVDRIANLEEWPDHISQYQRLYILRDVIRLIGVGSGDIPGKLQLSNKIRGVWINGPLEVVLTRIEPTAEKLSKKSKAAPGIPLETAIVSMKPDIQDQLSAIIKNGSILLPNDQKQAIMLLDEIMNNEQLISEAIHIHGPAIVIRNFEAMHIGIAQRLGHESYYLARRERMINAGYTGNTGLARQVTGSQQQERFGHQSHAPTVREHLE